MTHEEIEQYRKKLIEIIERPKQSDGNPAEGTKRDLRELAKRVGANTRAIYTDTNGVLKGYDAGISDLIDNIHIALQTATMIDMCKTSAKNYKIAIMASIIALLSALAAWIAVLHR
jgi:hypothetical protein